MDIDTILSKPAFSNMVPEQKEALRDLVIKLNNKTVAEAMPIMLGFMANAPKTKPLSAEEQEAMTEAVIESLNEAERAKFRGMLSLCTPRK